MGRSYTCYWHRRSCPWLRPSDSAPRYRAHGALLHLLLAPQELPMAATQKFGTAVSRPWGAPTPAIGTVGAAHGCDPAIRHRGIAPMGRSYTCYWHRRSCPWLRPSDSAPRYRAHGALLHLLLAPQELPMAATVQDSDLPRCPPRKRSPVRQAPVAHRPVFDLHRILERAQPLDADLDRARHYLEIRLVN